MDSLDDLYANARRAYREEKKREAAKPALKKQAAVLIVAPQELYADPDNWVRTRGVTLIHSSTRKLLGNFWEWNHRRVIGARRLIRSEEAIPVTSLEEVDFSTHEDLTPLSTGPRVETTKNFTISVLLDTPRVSAAEVELEVHYWNGWTARAVLVRETTFVEDVQILQLPAGVDVLPVLSRECKQLLRNV